ncbi:MarR family transcriptional regulator [Streptomyces sp. NPDC005385]|uniref:MarR family winged helix-turn-helix transcriptional regulator n=1 Tax=unclassified Streptomyces TaxID=2593676 RepID=UPI0033B2482C
MTATPAPASPAPSDGDFLRLDQQICFSLNAASRAFGGVYRVILKDLGLTYPQYLVMLVLWEHGELPVKKLGEHLRLDSGTLSPLLKRLEAAGLVLRERSTRDERSVQVRLTEEGGALRERAASVPRRIGAATGADLEEIRELRDRLDRLTAALDRAALSQTPGSA